MWLLMSHGRHLGWATVCLRDITCKGPPGSGGVGRAGAISVAPSPVLFTPPVPAVEQEGGGDAQWIPTLHQPRSQPQPKSLLQQEQEPLNSKVTEGTHSRS